MLSDRDDFDRDRMRREEDDYFAVTDKPPKHVSYPWRAEVANWSIPQRELWGRLANALEESGTPFPESERLAYERCRDQEPTPETRETINRFFKPALPVGAKP